MGGNPDPRAVRMIVEAVKANVRPEIRDEVGYAVELAAASADEAVERVVQAIMAVSGAPIITPMPGGQPPHVLVAVDPVVAARAAIKAMGEGPPR